MPRWKPIQAMYINPRQKRGALGLLDLCPGGVINAINHTVQATSGEAAFAHYVGRFRQSKFQTELHHGVAYREWRELGPQRKNVFNLVYTDSPRAHTGEMFEGEAGLSSKRIDLAGKLDGHKVFARAMGPVLIEICTAISADDAKNNRLENLREFELRHELSAAVVN